MRDNEHNREALAAWMILAWAPIAVRQWLWVQRDREFAEDMRSRLRRLYPEGRLETPEFLALASRGKRIEQYMVDQDGQEQFHDRGTEG